MLIYRSHGGHFCVFAWGSFVQSFIYKLTWESFIFKSIYYSLRLFSLYSSQFIACSFHSFCLFSSKFIAVLVLFCLFSSKFIAALLVLFCLFSRQFITVFVYFNWQTTKNSLKSRRIPLIISNALCKFFFHSMQKKGHLRVSCKLKTNPLIKRFK